MNRFRILALSAALCVLMAPTPSLAQEQASAPTREPLRYVSATGTGEVRVEPDMATIHFEVRVLDEDIEKAQTLNEEQSAKIRDVASQHDIPSGQLQMTRLTIRPEREGYGENKKFLGYVAERDFRATLYDPSQVEDFIAAILASGVKQVDSVHLNTTQRKEREKEAIALAIESAREKAAWMAVQLGQELGQPLRISEGIHEVDIDSGRRLEIYQGSRSVRAVEGFGEIVVSASATLAFALREKAPSLDANRSAEATPAASPAP
jgi:uncharacterized protein YggE